MKYSGKNVAVLGAGLSGTAAAMLLQSEGASVTVLDSADTCNAAGADSSTQFFATTEPGTAGTTGTRYFATDHSGMIRQDTAALADITSGIPLQ